MNPGMDRDLVTIADNAAHLVRIQHCGYGRIEERCGDLFLL